MNYFVYLFFLRTRTVIVARRLWVQIWRFILQSEVLLPVAPHPTTLQATANVKEHIKTVENHQTITASPRMARVEAAGRTSGSSPCNAVAPMHRATNETPHESMFRFQRSTTSGTAVPTRLLTEGRVLLRRHVRNKGDPLCDEVLLLEAAPGMRTSNIATDEKILSRRQTSPLVQTRGSS